MFSDQFRLAIQAFALAGEDRVNPIKYVAPGRNDLADYVTLEGVALAEGMMPSRFHFMFKNPATQPLSYIEGLTVGAAEKIDVVSTIDR